MGISESEVQEFLFQKATQSFLNSLKFKTTVLSFLFPQYEVFLYISTMGLTFYGQIPNVYQLLLFVHSFSILATSVKQKIQPQNSDPQ